jgi:hypothetical protein
MVVVQNMASFLRRFIDEKSSELGKLSFDALNGIFVELLKIRIHLVDINRKFKACSS